MGVVLGETLVNVLDFKKDMGLWHGVLTVSLLLSASVLNASCENCVKADPDSKPVICFTPECDEQNSHHQCALCSHEGLSSILGAASPRHQRFE